MPLTDVECKKIMPPKKGVTKIFDGGGLFLQINNKGGKYWRLQYYRPSDKKKDIFAIGVYPDISLKEARHLRDETKKLIANGIDPKQYKKTQESAIKHAQANTFEKIARQWHENRKADTNKWTPKHAQRVLRSLELHALPILGHLAVDTIMPLQVLDLVKGIEEQGKIDTAHRVLDVIRQVFTFAVTLRICLFNPASDLSGELKAIKQTPLPHIKDPEELGKLLLAISSWTGSPQVKALLILSPLVFTRPSEVRLMRWSEIDFNNATWTKDAAEMKNNIEHIIPLSRQALEVIDNLKAITYYPYPNNDWVFLNHVTKKPLSEGANRKALEHLGYKGKHTPHGWRHTASTLLNELGFQGDWIERQLAHKDPNVIRAAYNHASYLNDRIKMMQAWADYLDSLKKKAR